MQFTSADTARVEACDFCVAHENEPILHSRGKVTKAFYTEDSKRYITPKEYELLTKGIKLNRSVGGWDCLSSRVVTEYRGYRPGQTDLLYRIMRRRSLALAESTQLASKSFLSQFSMVKLWNMSIVGAILLGMFSMTMIYKYLGQGAAAEEVMRANTNSVTTEISQSDDNGAQASFAEIEKSVEQELYGLNEIDDKKQLEQEIRAMVKGYPIEEMAPLIAQKDRNVAAFLIAIAKKESNWGKRVPVLNGLDCNNYWGYRGQRTLMGSGGHTCFNSRKDAVDTVAKRIKTLIEEENLNTPKEMVVWKCGSNCAITGGQAAANKWISDVNKYYRMLSE